MKQFILIVLIAGWVSACSSDISENVGFVTRLGNDTLAVETFRERPYGFEAIVVLRSPKTEVSRYEIAFAEDGGIQELMGLRLEEGSISKGTYQRFLSVSKDEDSLLVTQLLDDGSEREFKVEYENGVLPFIDMVHWPYELALRKASRAEVDTVNQKMLSGSRISNFIIANLGGNQRTIRHPSRGVMDVFVDDKGHLITLDAAQTTRKLVVTRTEDIPIQEIADRFVALDAAGKSFGGLSGAVSEDFTIQGETFHVEYGSPAKRGRDLFGGIVPYGQRWRTGANRATHFKTSAEIMIGSLKVPAGEYTLFTIPEANGGTLIINKQTGQNGRSYNEDMDLGRVEMFVAHENSETENFTITITEVAENAQINLIWGDTVYYIPIKIL